MRVRLIILIIDIVFFCVVTNAWFIFYFRYDAPHCCGAMGGLLCIGAIIIAVVAGGMVVRHTWFQLHSGKLRAHQKTWTCWLFLCKRIQVTHTERRNMNPYCSFKTRLYLFDARPPKTQNPFPITEVEITWALNVSNVLLQLHDSASRFISEPVTKMNSISKAEKEKPRVQTWTRAGSLAHNSFKHPHRTGKSPGILRRRWNRAAKSSTPNWKPPRKLPIQHRN